MAATATSFLFLLALTFSLSRSQITPKVFYVDGQKGEDSNPGTLEKPFKTLLRAQDAVRKATSNGKAVPKGGVQVIVAGGDYDMTGGPLKLDERDSGSISSESSHVEAYPITWRALSLGTTTPVRFLAGKRIPNDAFKPASPAGVVKVNLKEMGLNDYGDLESGDLHSCANNKMELFYNDEPMTLARHPNIEDGNWKWMQIKSVTANSSNSFQFNCNGSVWEDTSTLWLHGYWKFDWADNYVRVASLTRDQDICTVKIDSATPFVYDATKSARFYALNSLSMLDAPGEYFIDRKQGILYFYPPESLNLAGEAFVSVGRNILTANGTTNVRFELFSMYYSRGTAVVLSNVNRFEIEGGQIANTGDYSVFLSGANSSVFGVEMFGNGCGGINVTGGDQKTLTRGGNAVSGCEIHEYSRWKRTYMPGIFWSGVGNTFEGNFVSNAPHSGILGGGTECTFQGNTLNGLCYETSDAGAFYSGRSWIDRGNIVAYNYFIGIKTTENVFLGYPSVQAIYLDDQMSGYKIFNNTFVDCQCGTFIGGGRRNEVYYNTYDNCGLDVHLDNRGMGWMKTSCQRTGMFGEQLNSVNYQEPPWSTHFPELVHIFDDHPCVPVYNSVHDNTYCHSDVPTSNFTNVTPTQIQQWMDTFTNNKEKC